MSRTQRPPDIESDAALGPLELAATEATALLTALPHLAGTPFAAAARTAARKVLGLLTDGDDGLAASLSDRIRLPSGESYSVPPEVLEALLRRRVLRLEYTDRHGNPTDRIVEPLALLIGDHWQLYAWCRMRNDLRGFRLDRIHGADVLHDTIPPHDVDLAPLQTGTARLLDAAALTALIR
ncbi:helix-turn-helix transcriptional regulator [Nocardia sp. NPDC020380]|uniref:helix-turn-helix transcriptional regulator n=1 Tax=Nocardia sp. NPDC020380 TaxID=3364309 RepID=UPI0037BBC1A6